MKRSVYFFVALLGASIFILMGMERLPEKKSSAEEKISKQDWVSGEDFKSQLEEAVGEDVILTEGAFKNLQRQFEQLSPTQQKALTALRKKLYSKRLNMVAYQPDFRERLATIAMVTVKAALVSGVLYILPIVAGNQEFSEEQLIHEFNKGLILGSLDAVARQLVGGGTQLVVTPVTAAALGSARTGVLSYVQPLRGIDFFVPETVAWQLPLSAVKSGAAEAVFQFAAREGGLLSVLTPESLVGAIEPEYAAERLESNKQMVQLLQDPAVQRVVTRLQRVLPKLLKNAQVLSTLNGVVSSAVQGAAIYVLLYSLGIEPQELAIEFYAQVGVLQGIINYIVYQRRYGALGSPGLVYASTLLATPVVEQGLTGLVPASAGIISNIVLNQVLGKKDGVKNLVVDFMSKTQFFPQQPQRWWQQLYRSVTEFMHELDFTQPYDIFLEHERAF